MRARWWGGPPVRAGPPGPAPASLRQARRGRRPQRGPQDQGVRPTRQPATITVIPMTERLYYTDSYLREFAARVVERSADGRTVYRSEEHTSELQSLRH